MEEENKLAETWEGLVSSPTLQGVDPDEAWYLLGDFCGIQKYHTALATSRRVEGADGEPGCVRHCVGQEDGEGHAAWAKERLLEMDAAGRSYSYDVMENNMGIGKYLATFKVVPAAGGGGCGIEWSFKAEPIDGWTRPGFLSYIEGAVGEIAARVGDALHANRST
ncbi:putative lachrymatory-factor synthase [Iris pallida]|uniref:Lachrymatory-factor synthase n=1 Tax=Iris pallida TaxID=29817 RepID=A0AAX6G7N4_IRIPA|nr:putative lachrymatory-factor synthase [Iris pallida]KAJ6830393.1 putative lachrymatory-factor synthase [Iris pallida]